VSKHKKAKYPKQQPRNVPPPKPPPLPERREIAVALVQDKYSTYPSNGLTPEKLAAIFKAADAGDLYAQMELFEEMEEKDPHLFSQLQTRKNAVTGLDFEILPFDTDNATDKLIAEFVQEQLNSIEGIEDVMMDLLDAIDKGIAISEIIWGYDDGFTAIKQIKHRHQKRFLWDENDALKVYTKDCPAGEFVPRNKFILHRYKARSGHPSRAGVLRVVAWMYLFKNYDLKDWVSFCEVYGMPLRLGTYDVSASEADKTALMQALINIGTDAAGMIPNGTQIEFKEASKVSSADIYERLARYCDEQMSKAILGQTLTSDSGSGSYAQSKTHNEVRHDLTVADCKALAATLRRDLIRPLVLFNFGEDTRIPSIRFDCEESEDLKESAEILATLIGEIGLKIPTSYLYKKFAIPKPEDGEEVVERPRQSGAAYPYLNTTKLPLTSKLQPHGSQEEVDRIAAVATSVSGPMFEKMFEPITALLDSGLSLEELKDKLEDEAFVRKLLGDMVVPEFEYLLRRSMILADLEGRVHEDG